jgi:hypothetical protein
MHSTCHDQYSTDLRIYVLWQYDMNTNWKNNNTIKAEKWSITVTHDTDQSEARSNIKPLLLKSDTFTICYTAMNHFRSCHSCSCQKKFEHVALNTVITTTTTTNETRPIRHTQSDIKIVTTYLYISDISRVFAVIATTVHTYRLGRVWTEVEQIYPT